MRLESNIRVTGEYTVDIGVHPFKDLFHFLRVAIGSSFDEFLVHITRNMGFKELFEQSTQVFCLKKKVKFIVILVYSAEKKKSISTVWHTSIAGSRQRAVRGYFRYSSRVVSP